MKVNIYETVEISDEQRVALARLLDGEGAKKRQATRDEIKAYIWSKGEDWAEHLSDDTRDDSEPDDEPEDDEEQDEDLLDLI